MSLKPVSWKIWIPVRDALLVQVDQGAEKLLHYVGSFPLIQVLFFQDVMEKFSTCAVLKHKEADALPLPHLVQFDDVRMVLSQSA